MSEPKRYEPSSHYSADFGMAPSPVGKWVSYADYARLKANDSIIVQAEANAGKSVVHYLAEIERLKAEVERLKAELADAQESYHLINERIAQILKQKPQP